MKTIQLLFVIVAIILIAAAGGVAPVFAQNPPDSDDPQPGDPSVWSDRVCAGEAGVVFQSEDEEGDGVTLTAVNAEGCDPDKEMGWLVIEPWFGAKLNPDRACLALSWDELQEFAELSGFQNGSAWRVTVSEIEGHAVVLPCLNAKGDEWQLGLNPYESQLDLRKLRGTLRLLDGLLAEAGMTRDEYLASGDPLAEQLNAALAN